MNFQDFKLPVQYQFEMMAQNDLFCVDVSGDDLWQRYLAAFPAGTDPIFRKRTEHDCSCCRQFIRTMGGVVAVVDGKVHTIWDGTFSDPTYRVVANALAAYVKTKAIDRPFLHIEKHVGTNLNNVQSKDQPDTIETFHHFFVEIPWGRNVGKSFYCPKKDIATKIGEMKTTRDLFLRGLTTLTMDAVETVLDIIANKSLYRGDEYQWVVTEFRNIKRTFDDIPEDTRELFAWLWYDKVNASVARIRNTGIGTLLIDLSEGVDLEVAVRKFESSVMAPENYKRPTALVSKAMVEKARQAVAELGITDALERRHANLTDISINDVLFADRSAKKAMTGDVFDQVDTKNASPKDLSKVETVGIEKFVNDILPNISSLEVMLENKHTGNLVSLIAPQNKFAKSLFKWGNSFSWTYNGELADSIKERVKRAGGNVTGDLCCRLAWYNYDDLDLHMAETNNRYEIYYTNRNLLSPSGGRLDVDMNAGGGHTREPVENIFYANKTTMKEGEYCLFVNQFQRRENDNIGFDIEIDWLGNVRRFTFNRPMRTGETILVARMNFTRANGIEFVESLPSTVASRTVWGLRTQDFHRVTTLMLSPNYWKESWGTGNKHYFFMLDGCTNDEQPRGFFNEFLIDALTPHRKVIEIVGAKSKVEPTANQLSGLGFSTTQRNELLVRAKGNYTRTLKVAF